jgi:2-polyprenyl-3-methyl-5-hydroxy-6-metoxy-1,4-benzoquinol methylase
MAPLLSAFLRQQRYKIVIPYIHGDVLDLGCGRAEILAWLQPGQHYVGVEGFAKIMCWLRANYPEHEFHQRDLNQDALALDGQFDTILMLAIIEHLKNPDELLAQIPSYLKPDGKLLITTPSPAGDAIHKIGARIGMFYKEAANAHATILTREALQTRVQRNGLKIVKYQRFLLGGNQLFVCQSS